MEEGGKVVFNLQRLPPPNRVGFPVVSSLRLTHLLSLFLSLFPSLSQTRTKTSTYAEISTHKKTEKQMQYHKYEL